MPTDPDRRDGRPAGPENPAAAAEAARLAVRETEAARETEAIRGTGAGREKQAARETELVDVRNHETRRVDIRRATPDTRPADGRRLASDARPTVRLEPGSADHRPTVQLPGQRRPDRARRAPLLVAAGVAALGAALVSYLPVAAVVGLARTLEGAGGLGGAAHAGLAGWLLGHGVPLGTSLGPLGLPPLLLTLLAGWRLNRAGVHVTRAIGARRSGSLRAALLVAAGIALWYAVLGAVAAIVVDGPGTDVSVPRALLGCGVLGAAGALIGSLRGTRAHLHLARRMPPALRHGLRTGLVAALLILAAGAGMAGLSVALGGGQAADLIAAYRTGFAGQAGITLLSLAYGANAVVWAAAYLLGPGFLIGAGSAVRLTEVTVGPLPTLPLLAGLPEGPLGAAGTTLLALPVLAGMAAGWALTLRLRRPRPPRAGEPPAPVPDPAWARLLGAALIAGPVAGVVLGLLAVVSGGPVGSGRLAVTGPVAWQVALAATGVVAVSAALGAAAARTFGPRRS